MVQENEEFILDLCIELVSNVIDYGALTDLLVKRSVKKTIRKLDHEFKLSANARFS